MKSKRATKETGTRIYCIATAIKASTHEIPIVTFATPAGTGPAGSVIPVALASSVIRVVTRSRELGLPGVDGVVCGREFMAAELHGISDVNPKTQDRSRVAGPA